MVEHRPGEETLGFQEWFSMAGIISEGNQVSLKLIRQEIWKVLLVLLESQRSYRS